MEMVLELPGVGSGYGGGSGLPEGCGSGPPVGLVEGCSIALGVVIHACVGVWNVMHVGSHQFLLLDSFNFEWPGWGKSGTDPAPCRSSR